MDAQTIISEVGQYALNIILAILLGAFVKYGAPFLQEQLEAIKLAQLKDIIADAVAAAEEKFTGNKVGLSVRKPWVKSLLDGLGYVVDDLVDAMIDSAARSLTAATKAAEAAAKKALSDAQAPRGTGSTGEAPQSEPAAAEAAQEAQL